MTEIFNSHTYPTLFVVSFLAATVIPLGSEWLLTAMLAAGMDPVQLVAIATAGNFLGACTTYLIGLYGGEFLIRRVLRIDTVSQQRSALLFTKYGSWSLLFSWLPVVGDPLCLAAGFFRIPWLRFSLLVATGKLGRYATVAGLVLAGIKAVNG